MVKFINRLTGTTMWVHEDRAEEYMEAGHTPAAELPEETKPAARKRSTAKAKK